ncbi:rhodanese-like domain-containing protein [uncultured Planktosalinus sp.]|uniref:rhodanese-like domain-containing protein n=1 Tax=uncultured Planktosalinus sp. TaxID=1810935 RepID=UPI0030D7A9ED
MQKITAEQLLDAIENKDVQLIDVRTEGEFKEGSIYNAQNICVTTNGFEQKVKNFDKTNRFICIVNLALEVQKQPKY